MPEDDRLSACLNDINVDFILRRAVATIRPLDDRFYR